MGLHDYLHRAVVAAIVIPAVVHFRRAPVIRATVKQVRYELNVTVATTILDPYLGTMNYLLLSSFHAKI